MNNIEGVGYMRRVAKIHLPISWTVIRSWRTLMTKMWSSFMHRLDPNDSGGMLNSSGEMS
jgi:hypothetical protein